MKPVFVKEETYSMLRQLKEKYEMPIQEIADEALFKALGNPEFVKTLETVREGLRRKQFIGKLESERSKAQESLQEVQQRAEEAT